MYKIRIKSDMNFFKKKYQFEVIGNISKCLRLSITYFTMVFVQKLILFVQADYLYKFMSIYKSIHWRP